MTERTCGNCKFLNVELNPNFGVFGCSKTGYVIPHEADFVKGVVKFWRVPPVCPRTDVKKSESLAPRKYWVIKKIEEFTKK